ncbi:hypothetical protein ACFOQM_04195 [Paenibacillus sp. GCM10012307]|uniref:Uncharacterized protein n=1 Tax=Paenibacillus roseus TaxID=2798579 RepID=A0A934J2Q9_9BACL|nr:hypothetical protein [Paenibacillus roseus]MBJ6360514.1 hypothetical protein [Paenibacillus roseus]
MTENRGRPTIGETRKVSITLPKKEWAYIDRIVNGEEGSNTVSAYFRIAHRHLRYDDPEGWGDRGIEPILGPFTMAVLRTIEQYEGSGDFEQALESAIKKDSEWMKAREGGRTDGPDQ